MPVFGYVLAARLPGASGQHEALGRATAWSGNDAQGGLDNAVKRVRVGEHRRDYGTGVAIGQGSAVALRHRAS